MKGYHHPNAPYSQNLSYEISSLMQWLQKQNRISWRKKDCMLSWEPVSSVQKKWNKISIPITWRMGGISKRLSEGRGCRPHWSCGKFGGFYGCHCVVTRARTSHLQSPHSTTEADYMSLSAASRIHET